MLFDDLKEELKNIEPNIKAIKTFWLNFNKEQEFDQLYNTINQENFWQNADQADILKAFQKIKLQKETLDNLLQEYSDLSEFLDLFHNDEKELTLIKNNILKLTNKINRFKVDLLLNKEQDHLNCFLSINPGAGGTESQDWAQMLLRTYIRFCEKENLNYQLIDYQQAEEAGIKSATLFIKDKNAYGLLKSEQGIHRLVRISPFDTSQRRHTSFAAISILPETPDIKVSIDPNDLRIDTYRASGAGGQHVNKTESAVRITHIPTNIVVQCQNERSQLQNKETALKMLKSKLLEQERRQQKQELEKTEKKKIEWGSQIRSYILHPYKLVKDHRTGYESYQPEQVLEGNLINFIESYLLSNK